MVTTGAILLGFLAIIFAFFVGKIRRKMGLPVKLKTIVISVVGFVIVVLALYAYNGHH